MDIDKLNIQFFTYYKKSYLDVPQGGYLDYGVFDKSQLEGSLPKADFEKRPISCYIKLKDKDLWLHYENKQFNFSKPTVDPLTLGTNQPLYFWIEYPRESVFFLYATVGFGVTEKLYFQYWEKDNKIYMRWVTDIKRATLFRYDMSIGLQQWIN